MVSKTINSLVRGVCKTFKAVEHEIISTANEKFNSLSVKAKRSTVIAFGAIVGFVCSSLIFKAIKEGSNHLSRPGDISLTSKIPMRNHKHLRKLIPLGKMKGEYNGEYDSFYVALDRDASIFINRNLEYSDSAYFKSNRWEKITQNQLKEYADQLCFIPFDRNGKTKN